MFALSKSEVRRILDAIDLTSPFGRRDYLMVLFMYHTGLRVGETSGLVIDLVDHDRYPRQYLHLPAAICKNSRGRVIPLNEVAQVCVVKLLTFYQQIGFSIAPDRALFQNKLGGHLSVRSIQKLVAMYREQAGLDVRATPHTLRHTFGSIAGELGFSELTIRAMLGHASQNVTQDYIHIDEALKLAVQRTSDEIARLLEVGAARLQAMQQAA